MADTEQAVDALAYSVSKWGIRGLTQACAQDLAESNIDLCKYSHGLLCGEMGERKADTETGQRWVWPGHFHGL